MTKLQERLRENCVGQPATIEWPHRILHEAADAIDAAEAEIARLRDVLAKDPNTMTIAYASGDHMRLVRAVSDRDETLKSIIELAGKHLPEYQELTAQPPAVGEDE